MSQTPSPLNNSSRDSLPGLPRRPLTPEQQVEALRKMQTQAEQRVKLGMQLFKAAEVRLAAQQDLSKKIREDSDNLREQIHQDVGKTLQAYDQWIGQIDESFTTAMRALEEKVDAMTAQWEQMRYRLEQMVARSESMFDQTRSMLEQHGVTPRLSPKQIETDKPRPAAKPAPPSKPAAQTPQISEADFSEGSPPLDDHIYTRIISELRPESEGDDGAESQAA